MRLATATVGHGDRTLALIHGASGDHGTWYELAPRIAERNYTVTLVDLRGHGMSSRADSYLPEEFADDVVNTLPAGLDAIIGHSLGGLALSHAVDRLDPVKAVYFDPGWIVSNVSSRDGITPFDANGRLLDAATFHQFIPRWSDAHIAQALASASKLDPVARASFDRLSDFEPPAIATRPSLVVLADPSELVPESLRERLIKGGYEIRTVTGAGHNFHIENLDATLQALEGWV